MAMGAVAIPLATEMRTRPRPACALCGTSGRLLHERLTDLVCGAPGEWSLRQCPARECGLVWLDPMPVEEDIGKAYPATYYTHASELGKGLPRRLYDAMGDGYLQRRFGYRRGVGSRWQRYLSRLSWVYPAAGPEFGVAAMYLPAPANGARLLDVGCGSGESLARMKELGWDVQGVDVDPSAVATAQAKGVPVHLGDLASARYADNTFDAIYVSHVVEHVHDPVGLLRECRRVLKVGGTLVVLTPNVDSWGHRRFGRAWHGLDPPRHLMLFRRETLAQVVTAAGLQIRRLTTTSRGATSVWLRSNQIRRGGPITLTEISGARAWLRALPYHTAQQWLLALKPEIGEELCLFASKTETPAGQWHPPALRDGNWLWVGNQWRPSSGLIAKLRHVARGTLPLSIRLAILATVSMFGSIFSRTHRREQSLVNDIKRSTGTRVITGPFAGMQYVDRAVGSEYPPKLLGTYERELQPVIEEIIARGYDTVINIGAAEGYYAVGLARRLPTAHIIAFETRTRSHQLLRKLAECNGVGDRILVQGHCTVARLEEAIPSSGRTLILCDIEGGEHVLMCPEYVQALRRADVLLELHDFAVPGVSAEVWERFSSTHLIRYIPTRPRSAADWPENVAAAAPPQLSLMSEGRPTPMHWFWMTELGADESTKASMSRPMISVIVLAYNSAGFVREAVDSILADRASPDNAEVIVLDNASQDETTATLRRHYAYVPGVRLLRTDTGLGFAGGNNHAARLARGDILLFLNDDCTLEPGCLDSIHDEFSKDATLGILQGGLASADGRHWDALGLTMDSWGLLQVRSAGMERTSAQPRPANVFAAKGAALAIKRSLFDQLGGFDESLRFLFEDADLSWRALLAGASVAVSGRAVVRHRQLARYCSPDAKLEGSAWYLLTRHRLRSMLKNFSTWRLLTSGTMHFFLLAAYAVRETCRGNPGRAHDVARALWWNVKHLSATLRLRHGIQRSRIVSDGQLMSSGRLVRGRPRNITRSPMW